MTEQQKLEEQERFKDFIRNHLVISASRSYSPWDGDRLTIELMMGDEVISKEEVSL